MGNIEESYEVRRTKRMMALPECFPGCIIELEGFGTGETMLIKRSFWGARASKVIAHIDMSPHKLNQTDEFHILFRKVEPLVVAAVEKFKELGVAKVSPYALESIIVIAHYPLDDQEDKAYQKLLAKSGRHAAFQETMERLDYELKSESIESMQRSAKVSAGESGTGD
jgi:hypothetical protein